MVLLSLAGNAVGQEGDFSCLVECAHGALECFLAHPEAVGNGFGGRVVAVGQFAARLEEFLPERVGKVAVAVDAEGLELDVEFAVGAHAADVAAQEVAHA